MKGLSAEAGVALMPDRRVVSIWLAGRCPRPPVPALVAEALTRRLGRPVAVTDTGLLRRSGTGRDHAAARGPDRIGGPEPGHVETEDAVAALRQLAGMDRRQILAGGVYSLALLAVPIWGTSLLTASDQALPSGRGSLTAEQVRVAEQLAVIFNDVDNMFGGGHSRRAVADYLAHDIAPRLHASASPALSSRMWTTATTLAYQCGFMCFDDQEHGLAQRFYRTALRLATETGNAGAYAIVLRAMSVQARSLGHHRHAVQLAEAAVATGHGKMAPLRQAFLVGQLAVAAAADGDRTTAVSALSAAERQLDRATSGGRGTGGGLLGNYNAASLAHQQAAVRALLGDRAGAITALRISIRDRPAGNRRSRAVITARLAELQLAQGQLEEAAATWHAFLDDYPDLCSARATTALKIARSSLLPYRNNPAAAAVLHRATPM